MRFVPFYSTYLLVKEPTNLIMVIVIFSHLNMQQHKSQKGMHLP